MTTTKKNLKKRKAGDSPDMPSGPRTTSNQVNEVTPEEIERIDAEVLNGMGTLNRKRLTHADPSTLTLRQLQAAGAEFIASLVGHPRIRKKTVEAALEDPIAILKIASSERPKEIHLEAEVQHSIVVVPAQQTPEEWDASVKILEGEVIKEDTW